MTSGACVVDFNTFELGYIDCQSTSNTCDTYMNAGSTSATAYDSYTNCISGTGCYLECVNTLSCILDMQSSNSATGHSYNTDKTGFA